MSLSIYQLQPCPNSTPWIPLCAEYVDQLAVVSRLVVALKFFLDANSSAQIKVGYGEVAGPLFEIRIQNLRLQLLRHGSIGSLKIYSEDLEDGSHSFIIFGMTTLTQKFIFSQWINRMMLKNSYLLNLRAYGSTKRVKFHWKSSKRVRNVSVDTLQNALEVQRGMGSLWTPTRPRKIIGGLSLRDLLSLMTGYLNRITGNF